MAAKMDMYNIVLSNAMRVYNGGTGKGTAGLKAAGKQIGIAYARTVKAQYSKGGTGKEYVHSKVGPTRASNPGEAPALQAGDLKDSVGFDVSRVPGRGGGGRFIATGRVVVNVFSTSKYAATHEYGLGQFDKRPAWRPVAYNSAMRKAIANAAKLHFVKQERITAAMFKVSPMQLPPIIIR